MLVCPSEVYRDGGSGGEEIPSPEICWGVDDRAGRHVVLLERRCLPGRMVALEEGNSALIRWSLANAVAPWTCCCRACPCRICINVIDPNGWGQVVCSVANGIETLPWFLVGWETMDACSPDSRSWCVP